MHNTHDLEVLGRHFDAHLLPGLTHCSRLDRFTALQVTGHDTVIAVLVASPGATQEQYLGIADQQKMNSGDQPEPSR